MLREILWLIAFTFIPFLELRFSIPVGIMKFHMEWQIVFFICIAANIILGPVVYLFLHYFINLFLKVRIIDRIWQKYVEKLQKKINTYVKKWGVLGVGLFIGIPLPGSGSYSGAIGSYVLGLGFKKFFWANIIGVLIAGIILTIASVTGNHALGFFIKPP